MEGGDTVTYGVAQHLMAKQLGNPDSKKNLEKALDHLRNLRDNAMCDLFWHFIGDVEKRVKPQHKALVGSCDSFSAFIKQLRAVRPMVEIYDDIIEATEDFCSRYRVQGKFWLHFNGVEQLTGSRIVKEHYSVTESADFLDAICDNYAMYPELDSAWGMVEALVNYSRKHADALNPAADAVWQASPPSSAEFQQDQEELA